MAAPLAGGVNAAQIAQQKLQDPGAQQQLKQGTSRFDQVMAQKAGEAHAPTAPGQVQAAQSAQKTQQVRQVEQVGKADKASLNRVNANAERVTPKAAEPVAAKAETGKATDAMMKMMSDLEKGQGVLDKLISGGLSGKEFSSSELLALQAGMYKYTQELELTGKVVEKATSGLKDTLKTQV